MSDIKETTTDNAAKLKPMIEIGEGGVVEVDSEKFVEAILPEDLSNETILKVQNFTSDIIAGTDLAFGEASIEAMKKNKKLEQTSMSFKVGQDLHEVNFKRVKQVPINKPGEERKTAPKYGIVGHSVTTFGAGNKGELKKVKAKLSEQATKVLGN